VNQQFDEMTARPRLNGLIFGSFAAIALRLSHRGRLRASSPSPSPIGIAMALGADATGVVRLVFRDALIPTAVGIAIGGRYLIAREPPLRHQANRPPSPIFWRRPPEPPSDSPRHFFPPARRAARAARVDPMTVLQADC
jgi:hypothetical protein